MKDFDSWSKQKKKIHADGESRFYHVREIWWCKLGVNIGFEQDGKDGGFQRPILIIKGLSRETCLVVPLTTSPKKNKYRMSLGNTTGRQSKVILSQMRVIDTKRLVNRIAILDEETFEAIRKSARDLF